jgi:glyoxalase family protein
MSTITGIHHVTCIAGDAQENVDFYTGTLGMRLVKKSVNQDVPDTYHLFYADGEAHPGADLTFFPWPKLPPVQKGIGLAVEVSLAIPTGSFDYWADRLSLAGVAMGEREVRHGERTLRLTDPHGLELALVETADPREFAPWDRSPVPAEHQIRGLGPIVLSVPTIAPTDGVLRAIGMRPVREYAHPENASDVVHVYEMGAGGPAAELHVAEQRSLKPARPGAGGVHHVAFRSNDADYDAWADRLNTLGIPNSGKVDRYWFRSLYFREPNGILFEIATDGPGFSVDEDPATLGEKIVLAPFLEPQREKIVKNLKSID